ncbi:MAG: DUF1674 domain-containing protein [Gammaproteobacteria bacterium]|nr:DUF1674 domain-containing protein [Gammaproteobacteria bacterium]NNC96539.1 DUF1674 domain-containing protein [Gammaproteobacteria bacterium]NNM13043.1 DUF1674 domain-containing protein [Gammaproteobacteria bacterium]
MKSAQQPENSSTLGSINIVVESDKNKSVSKENPDQTKNTPKKQEFGGRGGLEPTRYGDWEKNGRCIDF